MGQSVKNLSPSLKNQYSDVVWDKIISFRNILVHDYLGINLHRVWQIVIRHLPDLKKHIEKILNDLNES